MTNEERNEIRRVLRELLAEGPLDRQFRSLRDDIKLHIDSAMSTLRLELMRQRMTEERSDCAGVTKLVIEMLRDSVTALEREVEQIEHQRAKTEAQENPGSDVAPSTPTKGFE
jgi:polyhydroxyalkanoate synthesis regulator phasin